MRNKRWKRCCVPLLLACSLVLGSASVVTAENEPKDVVEIVVEKESENVAESISENVTDYVEASMDETLYEKNVENSLDVQIQAQSIPEEQDDSTDIEELVETDNSNNPEDTPYEELLSEDNLILVTVQQTTSPNAEEMSTEQVENLSEPEMQALEDYIEEQGYAVSREALLASASDTEIRTITFNMNGFLSLEQEGLGRGYDAVFAVHPANYQGNANAYCIDPSKQAPGHSSQGQQISYTTTVHDYRDPMLLKILYYGFGGPEDITADFASTPTARHILTHLVATKRAAELGIPGAGNYQYGANAFAISKAEALYSAIHAKEEILGTVSVLTPVPGQQTIMLLANYKLPEKEPPATTRLTIRKTVSGTGGNRNTDFHFTLTLTDPDGKEPAVTKEFTLHHGEEKVFEDLPVGWTYIIEETDGEEAGYTVTSEKSEGSLTKEPVEVAFRNHKEMIVPTGSDTNSRSMTGVMLASAFLVLCMMVYRTEKSRFR